MVPRSTTNPFLWPGHGAENLVLRSWGSEGRGGAGRSGARLAIQVFLVTFAQALVFICLAPSFPGTQRRGTSLSQSLSTPKGGREATGILIRGGARGWVGAPPSLLCLPAACRLEFLGQLDFNVWAQETAGVLSNYCRKERLQIKYSISKVIILGGCHYFWW